jgi:UDP-N-acetyl-L-fucosamine synthase
VRNAIERPEALDTGSIVITGLHQETILDAVELVTSQHAAGLVPPAPQDYGPANVAQRVLRLILGTARLSGLWHGLTPR